MNLRDKTEKPDMKIRMIIMIDVTPYIRNLRKGEAGLLEIMFIVKHGRQEQQAAT